jgi:hypothetical protein
MEKVVVKGQFEGSRKHFRNNHEIEKESHVLRLVKRILKKSRCRKVNSKKS